MQGSDAARLKQGPGGRDGLRGLRSSEGGDAFGQKIDEPTQQWGFEELFEADTLPRVEHLDLRIRGHFEERGLDEAFG